MAASKALTLLCLNLVFFTLVSSTMAGISKCPKDSLKIQACATVLKGVNGGLAHVVLGQARTECCSLLDGLVDLDAAVCLCTRVTADVLGLIHLDIPLNLTVLLNLCGKGSGVPSDYTCPN